MGFGNLSDFSNTMTTGRLLNHAFKKQEILQPSKMRLHDLCLKEIDNRWGDLPYLAIHSEVHDASFSVSVHSATKRPYRRGDEIVIDGELDVYGVFVRAAIDSRGRESAVSGTIGSTKIRADRLEDYYAVAVRFFFDMIYSIDSLKMVDTNEKWFQLTNRMNQRHKWKV